MSNPNEDLELIPEEEIIDVEIAELLEFLWEPKRYKILFGGRSSTKSWGSAQNLIALGHEKPTRILCAREIQRSIKQSVMKLLADTIIRMELQEYYTVQKTAIYHQNGTEFFFEGLKHNIDNIKSAEGIDIVWIAEAHNVSEDSWATLIPTIRKEGSEIWIDFNPRYVTDPTYVRFVAPYLEEIIKNGYYEDERIFVRKINYPDNPWFPEESRLEMEYDRKHDMDRYLHIWEGEPVIHTEARVFKNWEVDDSIEPEKGTALFFGADWGFAQDPTTLIRMWIDEKNRVLFIDYEVYKIGVEIDDTPALFDKIPLSREYTIRADSARPETISYIKKRGFKIVAAKKGPGSIEDGVSFLQSYTIKVHSRCKHVIDELKLYSYKEDKLTGDILPEIVDKNNHTIDPMRYGTEPIWSKTARKVRVMIINQQDQ